MRLGFGGLGVYRILILCRGGIGILLILPSLWLLVRILMEWARGRSTW
jgi:hypothetical protein